MDNAQLDMGLREDAVYRIREALQTIHTSNQDVLKAFIFGLSHAQQLFLAFGIGVGSG